MNGETFHSFSIAITIVDCLAFVFEAENKAMRASFPPLSGDDLRKRNINLESVRQSGEGGSSPAKQMKINKYLH
jgi:hypothetical protein